MQRTCPGARNCCPTPISMRRANGPLRKKTPSNAFAREKIYDAKIRNKTFANDQDELHSFRGVFARLLDDYRDRAHEIGKLRVVQGGYRTAELLTVPQEHSRLGVRPSLRMPPSTAERG